MAPFKKAKTKLAITLAGIKLLKAAKLAKIAKTVAILKNLKKSPIFVPVPVVLPVGKQLPSLPNIFGGPAAALAIASATGAAAPATEAPNQLDGFLTTATKALQAAGAGLPLLAAFQNSQKKEEPVTPSPVYRFVPEVGFTNYNKVSYQPRLEIEVPAPISYDVYPAYPVAPLVPVAPLTPIVQATPIIPAEPFGVVPADVYGLPSK